MKMEDKQIAIELIRTIAQSNSVNTEDLAFIADDTFCKELRDELANPMGLKAQMGHRTVFVTVSEGTLMFFRLLGELEAPVILDYFKEYSFEINKAVQILKFKMSLKEMV